MNNLIFYIATLFASVSLLITYFNSQMPCLILWILKCLGFKSKDKNYFHLSNYITELDGNYSGDYMKISDNPLDWTVEDWEQFANERLPKFFSHLLTCRFCLCYHIVFWFNILFFIPAYFLYNISFSIVFIAWFTQPALVHWLHNKILSYK